MKTLLTTALIAAGTLYTSAGVPVDFNKIEHWTGDGPNRAALVITNDAGASDPECYVWGFRWHDGETPTGDDMFRAICANSTELILLTQKTGAYGSTVCGIGFGDAEKLLQHIYFDFDMALDFEFINFDYYNASPFFGQSEAPGDDTPEICGAAVADALDSHSHVIEHPLDYPAYGYPAYDYDCWLLDDEGYSYGWWNSAWYTGYWSYWTASENADSYTYSGTGFSGRALADGSIDAWSFTLFESAMVGGMGEGQAPASDPARYSYRPANITSSAAAPAIADGTPQYYTLGGLALPAEPSEPGIYIVRKSGNTFKRIVK